MRKPSLKRSLKARTTGRAKRALKKAIIPGYGKKGAGWIKNPQKALYNKVYNKTTFSLADVFKVGLGSKSKRKQKNNSKSKLTEGNVNMEEKAKVPFYKKKWFLILISLIVPVAGIVVVLKSKGMNKILKGVLTAVASLWSVILLAIGLGGGETETPDVQTETTTVIAEESTTHAPVETTTAPAIIEESTTEESTTEATTEQLTTEKETTTAKLTTTKKETTTTKPTTTKKVTTTAKPTTTKKVTTTVKQTTTIKVTENPDSKIKVYRTKSGEKYHYENPCGNGTYYELSLAEAKAQGLDPCEKCVLH